MAKKLRPYQEKMKADIYKSWDDGSKNVLCVMPTGGGKCLGENTPVLMFNGEIKAVQDIKVGDKLMGPDSTPRIVKSICDGESELFKITPVKGEPWICNDVHILSLINTETNKIIDIPINEYLKKSENFKQLHKQLRTGINFHGEYYKVNTNGHLEQTLVKVKRKQIKDVLRTGFKVESQGKGKYFGFEIDKDGRFLLGDFTVTHNTVTFCSIAIDKAINAQGNNKLPTAITVHRKELVQQICLTLAEEGINHNIIAPRNVIQGIVAAQRTLLKKQFYDYNAPITVISVDTLNSRILKHQAWAKSIKFWIVDEAAHLLKQNKWGRAITYFPNAIGLGVTATPERLDKRGLGSHVDGVFDKMVQGPNTKWMIDNGFLCKYKIAIPESDYKLHLKEATGDSDYSKEAMIVASQKSHIVGDVVKNYKKFAEGKQAIVFASDIGAGERMETKFREAGISAKLLTGMTEDSVRLASLIDYRDKKIQVLINVDLFDEGLDVPGIECVIMARPTKSLGKYLQMCLDEETEILTKRGWLKQDQIEKTDLVAGFKQGKIEWCEIENLIKRNRELGEKMYSYSSPNLNFRVTSHHDMIVKSRKSIGWIKEDINKTITRKESFHVPISGCQDIKKAKIKDCELSFLGWFLSDGTRHKENDTITISQSVSQQENLKNIRKTLNACNFKFSEYRVVRKDHMMGYPDLIQFNVPIYRPKRNFKSWSGKSSCEHLESWLHKSFPEIYESLNEKQIEILLYSLNLGDGNKNKTAKWNVKTMSIAIGDNLTLANKLQSLLIRRGYRCNLSTEKREKLKRKDCYRLFIRKLKTSSIAGIGCKDGAIKNKKYKRSRIIEENIFKKEIVWCVKNKLGSIVTRRNGKVLIMGNCGRGLRPHKEKPYLILIDHVGNVSEHGLPDAQRKWTLDRIIRRKKKINLIRICKNPKCNAPFDRISTVCPFCGTEDKPQNSRDGGGRVSPTMVDGDLVLLDPDTLRDLATKVVLEDPASVAERVSHVAGEIAGVKAMNNQIERIKTQKELAEIIAIWAGIQRDAGLTDRMINKKFFIKHNKTIWESLGEPRKEMLETMEEIKGEL